ncbi:MAG: PhnD/SsuA/transferrin family substrate-binding protein [Methylobacter sp.]
MRLKRWGNACLLIGFMLFPGSASAEDLFAEQTLRIGFYTRAFPDFSSEDLEITVKVLGEEIGNNAGFQTTVTVYSDIALMRSAFEQGKINFVLASTLNLINDFDNSLLTDGFRVTRYIEFPDSLAVLTRKYEHMDDFKSLRGKRLALVEYDPVADLYMDYLALTAFNKGYKASFKEIPRERKAQQVILKLFFGQADVICVYLNTYNVATELNPQLLSKLQIIAQLDGVSQGAGLFHKNVPPVFRERVIAEVLKLDTHVRGQQLLQVFKADKAIRASVADLNGTKQLYADYQQLKKSR